MENSARKCERQEKQGIPIPGPTNRKFPAALIVRGAFSANGKLNHIISAAYSGKLEARSSTLDAQRFWEMPGTRVEKSTDMDSGTGRTEIDKKIVDNDWD